VLKIDPILQTAIAFVETLLENPVTAGIIMGTVRSITGWIQKKYVEKMGMPYDKKILGATILKYTVAITALTPILASFGLDAKYINGLAILTDIGISFAKKLKNHEI